MFLRDVAPRWQYSKLASKSDPPIHLIRDRWHRQRPHNQCVQVKLDPVATLQLPGFFVSGIGTRSGHFGRDRLSNGDERVRFIPAKLGFDLRSQHLSRSSGGDDLGSDKFDGAGC